MAHQQLTGLKKIYLLVKNFKLPKMTLGSSSTLLNPKNYGFLIFVTLLRNKVKLSFCNGLQFLFQAEDIFLQVGK